MTKQLFISATVFIVFALSLHFAIYWYKTSHGQHLIWSWQNLRWIYVDEDGRAQ